MSYHMLYHIIYCAHIIWPFRMQTLHNERFLLVVKSTPPLHGESATAGIAAVPVISQTTLLLVSHLSNAGLPCQ